MELFEAVADALRGMVPPELGEPRCTWHRYGVKVWFGPEKATRLHYEAQVVGPRHVPEAEVLALEVGFHAEEPKPDVNDAVLAHLLGAERRWRRTLGTAPVAGEFLGRDTWARVSEVWLDPDLSDEELGVEVAARLVDYVEAIEPEIRSWSVDTRRG